MQTGCLKLSGWTLPVSVMYCASLSWGGSFECDGDTNGDLVVDQADLNNVLGAWGTANIEADLNASGLVGFDDLTLVLDTWGNDCRFGDDCTDGEADASCCGTPNTYFYLPEGATPKFEIILRSRVAQDFYCASEFDPCSPLGPYSAHVSRVRTFTEEDAASPTTPCNSVEFYVELSGPDVLELPSCGDEWEPCSADFGYSFSTPGTGFAPGNSSGGLFHLQLGFAVAPGVGGEVDAYWYEDGSVVINTTNTELNIWNTYGAPPTIVSNPTCPGFSARFTGLTECIGLGRADLGCQLESRAVFVDYVIELHVAVTGYKRCVEE